MSDSGMCAARDATVAHTQLASPHENAGPQVNGLDFFAVAQTSKHYPADVLASAGESINGVTLLWRHKFPSKSDPSTYLGKVIASHYEPTEQKLYVRGIINADTEKQREVIDDILNGKLVGVSVASIDHIRTTGERKVHHKSDFVEVSITPKPKCAPPECGIISKQVFSAQEENNMGDDKIAMASYEEEVGVLKAKLEQVVVSKHEAEAETTRIKSELSNQAARFKALETALETVKMEKHELAVSLPMREKLLSLSPSPKSSAKYAEHELKIRKMGDDELTAALWGHDLAQKEVHPTVAPSIADASMLPTGENYRLTNLNESSTEGVLAQWDADVKAEKERTGSL